MTTRDWTRYAGYGLGALLVFLVLCSVAGTDRVLSGIVAMLAFIGYSVFYPLSMLII